MYAYDKYVTVDRDANYVTYTDSGVTTSLNRNKRCLLAGSDLNRKGDRKTATPFYYSYNEYSSRVGSDLSDRTSYDSTQYRSGFSGVTGDCVVLTPPYNPDFSETTQTALMKVYDQIRGNGEFLVDAFEGSQTLRMLKATLNLKKFVKEFLKELVIPKPKRVRFSNSNLSGQKTAYQQRLDYATGKWLEVRYGWTPLVNSIYTAADLLFQKERNRIVTAKGRSGRRKLYSSPTTGSGTYGDPHQTLHTEWGYRSEIELAFQLPPGLQVYDWTTLNPAKLAWELLPLSFVADWVLNISDVLSQFENYWLFKSLFFGGWQSDSSFYNIYRTTSGSTNYNVWYWPNGTIGPNQTIRAARSFLDINRNRTHRRFLLGELPYSNKVRININIGAKRQLDAAALIHTLIGKKLR